MSAHASGRRTVLRDLGLVLALALLVRALTALPMRRPGYMDAAYYVDGALSLYHGQGFVDPFIWNYLDSPAGIPAPSHLYWMPLSSILAYLSFLAFGPTYRAAQVPFALLSSLLAPLSYLAAYDLAQDRRQAWGAALLAVFSGFYMVYWVTPDNFAPFALAGALCLWGLGKARKGGGVGWYVLSGVCAALAHLARADGPLLLLVGVVLCGYDVVTHRGRRRGLAWRGLALVGCYLLVMAPWLARNLAATGRLLSTSGIKTLWLTDYDDLYSYGESLTVQSYLAWGWANIARSKLDALWKNLGQVAFAGWMIYLAPLGAVGVWRLRRRAEMTAVWLYGVLLYLTMSLGFTYPGWRGGMFHSLGALLPAMYAAALVGLDACVAWASARRPHWQPAVARRVFGGAAVAFAIVLSTVLYAGRVGGFRGEHPYERVAEWMAGRVPRSARVMVNDPPSFYYHARRPCVAIPNGDLETVLQVADRYEVAYLVLDRNNPSLSALYEAPASDPRLELQAQIAVGGVTTLLFEVAR
ncbi:MAG: glycosyltransferase family 39 protein [Anaerolineae bacterium]|nr:glycosyltransferase family 39 protein [Anaerolineae bacterium]